MLRRAVPYLVYAFVTLVGWTNRMVVEGGEIPEKIHSARGRFIYAFWHQRQVFFTWTHRGVDAAVLVSRSKDGELIADGAAGGAQLGPVFGGNVVGGVGELAADALGELHQEAIGFAGDDVGIEDGGGDAAMGGQPDGDAGGISAQADDGGGEPIEQDLLHLVGGFAPTGPEFHQAVNAAGRWGWDDGLGDEFVAGGFENFAIDASFGAEVEGPAVG